MSESMLKEEAIVGAGSFACTPALLQYSLDSVIIPILIFHYFNKTQEWM
jgi:hypothetical protein